MLEDSAASDVSAEEAGRRERAIEAIESYLAGEATGDEFRHRWPTDLPGGPVHDIGALLFRVAGHDRLDRQSEPERRRTVAVMQRCSLFLRHDARRIPTRPEGLRDFGQLIFAGLWVWGFLVFWPMIDGVMARLVWLFDWLSGWLLTTVVLLLSCALACLLPLAAGAVARASVRHAPRGLGSGKWGCWPFATEADLLDARRRAGAQAPPPLPR